YFELNAAGLAAHRRAAAEGKAAPWLHLTGHLQWAVGDAGQSALHAKDERLRAWGYAVRRLRRSEVPGLEPDLLLDGVDEVSYYPTKATFSPCSTSITSCGWVRSWASGCAPGRRSWTSRAPAAGCVPSGWCLATWRRLTCSSRAAAAGHRRSLLEQVPRSRWCLWRGD